MRSVKSSPSRQSIFGSVGNQIARGDGLIEGRRAGRDPLPREYAGAFDERFLFLGQKNALKNCRALKA